MNSALNLQLLAGGMRALTLSARFILLFYLATKLDLYQMGVFSLYWAALQLSSSLIPLDVYAQTTRLLLSSDSNKLEFHVGRHFGFLFLSIIFFVPVAVFLNTEFGASLTGITLFVFIVHLPVEIFATDAGRLLVPLKKPLLSNIVLFVRSALWVLPLILFLELGIVDGSPVTIASFWLLGSILSLLVILFFSKDVGLYFNFLTVDVKWIRAAISAGFVFLFATVIFRMILGIDRFLVGDVFGEEIVAIYSIYASCILGVLALIESGVSAWHYPAMVEAIKKQDLIEARLRFKSYFIQNILYSLLLFSLLLVIFPVASYFFLPGAYFKNISLLFILSIGVFFYCITMPFHYALYGFGHDRYFLLIYGFSLSIMVVWYLFFMRSFGVNGAGLMLSLSMTSISILRVIYTFRVSGMKRAKWLC